MGLAMGAQFHMLTEYLSRLATFLLLQGFPTF